MSSLSFFVFVALLLFALANGAAVMRRLETRHPDVWNALGRPNFAASTGIAPRLALVRFIWSQRYRALDDAVLTRHCVVALLAEPLLVLAFVYLLLG
jgi:hypothetical protein